MNRIKYREGSHGRLSHDVSPKSNAFKYRVCDDEKSNIRMHIREFALGLVQQIPVRIDSLVSMDGTDSGRNLHQNECHQ